MSLQPIRIEQVKGGKDLVDRLHNLEKCVQELEGELEKIKETKCKKMKMTELAFRWSRPTSSPRSAATAAVT